MLIFGKYRSGAILALGLATVSLDSSQAQAESWLLIETRSVPNQCERPLECVARSTLLTRNMAFLTPSDRDTVTGFLNQIATIRGIPDDLVHAAEPQPIAGQLTAGQITQVLQPIPRAEKLAPLVGHPGAFFDTKTLDDAEVTEGFSAYVITELQRAGFRFLTREEMEQTPGRPKLSLRFTPRRESAGCIIPFSISLSISEEVVMVRNPALKLSGSAWAKTVKENLANRNYAPRNSLEEVVSAFAKDWQTANPG